MENCHESTGLSRDAFRFHWTSNYPQYLISPELVASEKKVAVSFEYKVESTSNPESFAVGYSTTTNDLTSFTWGEETANCVNTSYVEYSETLPENVKYVAIKCTSNDKYYLYIDNFSVAEYEAPACEMPTGLAASEITANSAKIAWTSEATAWKLQTSADGENWTDAEGEITNPYTLNALTENTKYYVRVCANCGANGDSEWTAAINFTTDCAVKSLPFATEGFESGVLPDCWSAASQWTIYSYPNDGHDSNTAMRFNASTTADLTLPTIALNDKAQLTFWRRSSSVSCSVYVNDGESETNLGDFAKSSEWTQTTVDLSAYAGKTVSIIIRGNYYGSYKYLYIDDVTVNYAPVAAPTNLAVEASDKQASISWTNIEEDATYNLRHKATAAEEWTTVNGVTSPYVLGGLTNDTEYEVQVQAVASEHRVSEWTASATFIPVACASIQTVTFGDKTYNSVVVNWTATAAGKWDVRYKGAGDADYTEAGTNLTVQTITLNDLKTNVAYTIEVKAACSEEWTAAETLTLHYSSPTNITASNIKDVTATLSWDAVADAPEGKYKYMLKKGLDFYADDYEKSTEVTGTTVDLTNLKPATTYRVYVFTVYGEDQHSGVTEGSLTTGTVAPYDLEVSEITTTSAHFTWQFDGYSACCYQYAVGDDPNALEWNQTSNTLCNVENFTLNGLQPGTTYTLYVRSDYGNDIFGDSVSVSFTTLCAPKALPFEEDFEQAGLPNCWESEDWSESVAAGKWSRDNNYSHSGFSALRFNANTDASTSISSPEIVLSKKAELSFFLRNGYGANAGYVEGKVIAADVENGENKVEAEFIHAHADNLTEQKLDLSALEGKTVKITFLADGVGTSTNASLYIDDVKVTEITEEPVATGMDNTSATEQVIKTVENGQIVIILNGVKYNAQGQKL